jgi:hypothetical protein
MIERSKALLGNMRVEPRHRILMHPVATEIVQRLVSGAFIKDVGNFLYSQFPIAPDQSTHVGRHLADWISRTAHH